jgi:hypothetical protein
MRNHVWQFSANSNVSYLTCIYFQTMNSRYHLLCYSISGLLLLSSCMGPFAAMYGVSKPKLLSDDRAVKYCERFGIPASECFMINDSAYISYMAQFNDSDDSVYTKNHCQPLQACYFDSSGKLVSYQVNCYAGGFPNLNWKGDGVFKSYPPAERAPLDTLFCAKKHLDFIIPIYENVNTDTIPSANTVIVYWSKFMGRQSKRFLKTVQKHRREYAPIGTKYLFVNNDALFLKLRIE